MTTPTPPHPTPRRRLNLPLIAWAALPLTVGMVLAQTGTAQDPATQAQAQRVQPAQPGATSPAQPRQAQPGTGTNYADVFLQKLAAQLGITLDKLKAAATAAGTATIDQGVRAGDFTADQAAFMKQNLAQNPLGLAGGRGFGGPGGRHGGLRAGGPAVTAAVARALGLTEQQLVTELQAGKTIAQLAQAKGVSTASLHAAAVAALKTALAAEVTAGRLTQAQADQMIQQAQADANFGLTPGGPGLGRGGRGGRGGFHDRQDGAQDSTLTDPAAVTPGASGI
jgi:hypothetical protein